MVKQNSFSRCLISINGVVLALRFSVKYNINKMFCLKKLNCCYLNVKLSLTLSKKIYIKKVKHKLFNYSKIILSIVFVKSIILNNFN